MWLASLRRMVLGNSRSPKVKQVRSQRRRIIPRLDLLEDRIVPSTTLTVDASDYNNATPPAGDYSLVGAITAANQNSSASNPYTINLTNSTYNTGTNNTTGIGNNALPVITSGANITIDGNGATINGQSLARLFDVAAGATVTLENVTLTGGLASGATAKGGAVYNSGNLSMKAVVVGGNKATGGSTDNGEGGGIYSIGGTLTLVNDVIGLKVHTAAKANFLTSTASSKHTSVGAANTATGGTGGSGQGAGLYVSGGTVKVSQCVIAGNHATGGANGQGGGIYASFASSGSLTLVNHDIIGNRAVSHDNYIQFQGLASYSTSAAGANNTVTGGTSGNGQGAGLYVNVGGGTVKISSATFGGNHAYGGSSGSAQGGGIYANGGSVTLVNDLIGDKDSRTIGHNGSGSQTTKQAQTGSYNNAAGGTGGNGQGGGIYANAATLSLTNTLVNVDSATGGGGAAGSVNHFAGGVGGNAQGGGIFANATTVTLSGGSVDSNSVNPGRGGNGASGTSKHPTGGAGGTSGIGQGGGVYVQGGSLTINNGASVSLNSMGADKRGGDGGTGYSNATTSTYGAGGAGGAGGAYEGGNVFASNASSVLVEGNAQINEGTINGAYGGTGGAGGKGKTGGQGANAGFVAGGGLYIANGSVTLGSGVAVNDNSILPGWGGYGGNGGIGGNGGAGGTAEGGGLYALNASVTLLNGSNTLTTPSPTTTPGINDNTVNSLHGFGRGGNGGSGTAGAGGNGGAGGLAQGGGVFTSGSSTLAVTLGNNSQGVATLNDNSVAGGDGGSAGAGHGGASGVGGAGGLGTGGGITVIGDKLTLTNATIANNSVQGGYGGLGASTGNGFMSNFGNGGDAQGGGLFVANSSSVSVLNSTLTMNSAQGGSGTTSSITFASGSTAKYGVVGTALGGAMYADGSTVNVLNSTLVDNNLSAGANPSASKGTAHQNNGGTAQGGGLYAAGGTLSLTNDTIAWDYLVTYTNLDVLLGQGAGLYNGPSNTLNLENTILALNVIFSQSQNSINLADGSYGDLASDSTATTATSDDNLIGGVNGVLDANLLPGASEQLFAPAALTSRQFVSELVGGQAPGSYSGLTYTMPLAWNTSPAISQGDATAASTLAAAEGLSAGSSTADQRGLTRVIDGTIDIGATETQVILNGSPSVTTVQTGGTVTYTLTVANNESTAANVTLTDVLDANTTYQSSNTTGWSVTGTPSTSSPGGTLTATISLAANTSATLTIIVTVDSNAPGSTTLANTASIVPTGNNAAGARSVAMDTQTQGATNLTKEVGVLRSPALPDPFKGSDTYVQGVLLFNWSGITLTGPIALVLVGLPSDVTLLDANGYYDGSPYINIVAAGQSWEAGWWHFLITMLEFDAANWADIKYTPEILQGI